MIRAARVSINPRDEFVMGEYYVRLDTVRYNNCLYLAKMDNQNVLPTDKTAWMFLIDNGIATDKKVGVVKVDGVTIKIAADGTISGTIDTQKLNFTEAGTRANIQSGETLPTIMGKIKKVITDLKAVAFSNSYNDLDNKPTSLKNPQALTFTGGASGSYDGSAAKSVKIPNTPSEVGADASGSASKALTDAKAYTDTKISNLIGGASSTMDTLKEIEDELKKHSTTADALDAAIAKKADLTAFNTHKNDNVAHITYEERQKWNDADARKHDHGNKSVLDGITSALITTWNTVSNKVDKVTGKGLSTNDYTTDEKNKLAGIAAKATANAASTTVPKANGTASAGSEAAFARGDHIHPLQTSVSGASGSCSGNAATATKLQTARAISLTGDVTGSANFDGSAAASIAATLANSGVTAGSYGPTAAATLAFGGSVNVPFVKVDAKGRVTQAAHYAIKLPATPTSVSGNAGTATKLATARTIDGFSFDGSANIHHYGTCTTAAATAAKAATVSGTFTLATGAMVLIKMSNNNTVATPTLNVNSTGAKEIKRYGTTAPSTSAATSWQAGSVVLFAYDGTYWQMVGWLNDNTTYANMKAATADAAGSAGLVPAPGAGKQASFLRGDGTWVVPTNTTYTAASATPLVAGTGAVGTSAKYAREDHVHPAQTSVSGNAGTATKLATARSLKTKLDSTAAVSFDGSAARDDIPVTGTLGIANGGTGATTAANARSALGITCANLGALPLSGGTMTGTMSSSKSTGTYLAGNQGQAIINSTASAGAYVMLAKMNSTGGFFTIGTYQTKFLLQYTVASTVSANTNGVTKSVTLLDESGNSAFPGTVSASAFSGNASSATKATQDGSGRNIVNTYALKSIYGDTFVSLGRTSGTTVGANSFAYGNNVTASGEASHAEGCDNVAEGKYDHAEGYKCTASGTNGAHAEGYISKATGLSAHAEGYSTASNSYSHAEGCRTRASGKCCHSEGNWTIASGDYSHAEGLSITATSNTTVAASGLASHAEGSQCTASGSASHAEGNRTIASGDYSHSSGFATTASNNISYVIGHCNADMTTGGTYKNTTGHAFVIGNGTYDDANATISTKSNAFSVMFNGVVKAKSTITGSTTADYAEFFEWLDENPDNEDRVGKFVTLEGDKIRIAKEGDYILGIVSGEPFVLGNGDCDTWNGMYLKDEFNRTIYEPAPLYREEYDEETGEIKYNPVLDEDGNQVYQGTRPVLNPKYDPDQAYVSRFDRKEWSPVGMLGVLSVIDDGTCEVGGYCTCSKDGMATASEVGYRVLERKTDNIVTVYVTPEVAHITDKLTTKITSLEDKIANLELAVQKLIGKEV